MYEYVDIDDTLMSEDDCIFLEKLNELRIFFTLNIVLTASKLLGVILILAASISFLPLISSSFDITSVHWSFQSEFDFDLFRHFHT